MVRLGIGLYAATGVVRLHSHIMQTRTISAGQSVGYNATYTAKRPMRIALLPVGYADGYPFALGNAKTKATAMIAGSPCPVIGRVSMDILALDISAHKTAKRGTRVDLIGTGKNNLQALAKIAQTIPYELLTRLGSRYKRVYES